MLSILRIVSYFILITTVMSSILLLQSYSKQISPLDTDLASHGLTCDQSEVSYFVNNLGLISNEGGKKMFVFGASNARMGFRPSVIKRTLSDFDIYNLGFSSGNVSEAILALNIIEASKPIESYKGGYAVLAISFGALVNNTVRWHGGPSPLEYEIARYSLYEIKNHKVLKKGSELMESFYSIAGLPFRCGKYLINKSISKAKYFLKNIMVNRNSSTQLNTRYGLQEINAWKNYYKAEEETFFDERQKINTFISNAMALQMIPIIVDMPLDILVYENSLHDKFYAKSMEILIEGSDVNYINMRGLAKYSKFDDLVHPTDESARMWSKWFADEIIKYNERY